MLGPNAIRGKGTVAPEFRSRAQEDTVVPAVGLAHLLGDRNDMKRLNRNRMKDLKTNVIEQLHYEHRIKYVMMQSPL